jgi:23S rRNA (guanosine2251-2'-O)-methyltransferase
MHQLEGKICVEAALMARKRRFQLVLIRQGLHADATAVIVGECEKQGIPIKYLSNEEINRMAHGKTHGGVLALCGIKEEPAIKDFLEKLSDYPRAFLLLLEGVDDSHNFGFVIRTSEAMGVHAILLKKHLWDFDSGAVSRASSGAYERMPIIMFEEVEKVITRIKYHGISLLGCIANASKTIYEVDMAKPVMLALGGEKRGLSAAVREHCDRFIKIPMLSDIGSLSLSHASAILMAEVMRQRMRSDEKT